MPTSSTGSTRRARPTPTCAALDRRVGGDGRVRRALRPRRRGAGRGGHVDRRLQTSAERDRRDLRADERLGAARVDVRRRPPVLRHLRPVSGRPDDTDPAGRRRRVGADRRAPAHRRTPPRHAAGPLRPRRAARAPPRRRGRACAAASRRRPSQIRQRRLVVEWLVNRAIDRSHLPEAVSLYLRFALTPVVQLLRARDCPERHDYALRYLHTDLRPADAARIDQLLPGVERLRELSAECFAWQDELLHTDSSAV